MKIGVAVAALVGMLALVVAGCGGSQAAVKQPKPKPAAQAAKGCTGQARAGWQRLANRIGAPVFCPAWMPDPFHGILGDHRWNTINSVSKDRSYLMGFIWLEPGSGELHVNVRGYPAKTKIPICDETEITGGKTTHSNVPCFEDPKGTKRLGGRTVQVYTRNHGADLWHVLYAWRYKGSLYTLSQHVAAPLTYAKVVADLDRMMRGLQVIEPST